MEKTWAVISAIAAVAALFAVYQARVASHEQILANRPDFTLLQPGIKPLPNSPPFRIQITMENMGGRPAAEMSGELLIADQALDAEPVLRTEFTVGNEILPKTPTP